MLHQPGNIFADDIKLQVNYRTYTHIVQVSMFIGVRNNSHRKAVSLRVNYRKADTVYTNGTFLYRYVALRSIVLKSIFPAALKPAKFSAGSRLVNMALHNVPIKAGIHLHAAFQVNQVAHF